MKKHLIWVTLLALSFSCRPPVEKTHHFSLAEWNRFETVNYHAILEHTGTYDISMRLVYSDPVSMDHLTVGLTMETPYNEERYLEQDFPLFRDGQPLGIATGEEEGQYEVTIPFFREVRLQEQGYYEFRIDLLVNKYSVAGVHQLTLVLEPV